MGKWNFLNWASTESTKTSRCIKSITNFEEQKIKIETKYSRKKSLRIGVKYWFVYSQMWDLWNIK